MIATIALGKYIHDWTELNSEEGEVHKEEQVTSKVEEVVEEKVKEETMKK
jgi:hypothetical protein